MAAETKHVIETKDLFKTFFIGFMRKRVEALQGVSFSVERNQVFGFLGPNGAGKTTTIKTLIGLLRPTSGSCSIFGSPPADVEARRRIGYLPETPYFYDHLLPEELMDLVGRLRGLGASSRRQSGRELLERVGLSKALDRPLRKFSKGMLQRIGLAQAMLGDPELLILDEPMTGLDPIGRKEVRDLIVELRDRGKTILFSSHILADVETLCDCVAIVREGKVAAKGALSELLSPEVRLVELVLGNVTAALLEALKERSETCEPDPAQQGAGDQVLSSLLW